MPDTPQTQTKEQLIKAIKQALAANEPVNFIAQSTATFRGDSVDITLAPQYPNTPNAIDLRLAILPKPSQDLAPLEGEQLALIYLDGDENKIATALLDGNGQALFENIPGKATVTGLELETKSKYGFTDREYRDWREMSEAQVADTKQGVKTTKLGAQPRKRRSRPRQEGH